LKIIKPSTVRAWARMYPAASASLLGWLALMKAAKFGDFASLRATFALADMVRVKSGRKVIVFNIGGNNYRLIVAVHFNTQRAFALRLMTHADYSKDKWKEIL